MPAPGTVANNARIQGRRGSAKSTAVAATSTTCDVPESCDTVAHLQRHAPVVGHKQHGQPQANLCVAEQWRHSGLSGYVPGANGLVGHQHVRLRKDTPG